MSEFKKFLDKILCKDSISIHENIEYTEIPQIPPGLSDLIPEDSDYGEYLKTQLGAKKHENLKECNQLAVDFYGIEMITATKGYTFASGFKFLRGAPGKIIDEKAINLFDKEQQTKIRECLNKNHENVFCCFDGILTVLPAEYIRRKKGKK